MSFFPSHRQPHVLDVAELLPGHLRIFSLARGSSLYKRALLYYSAKSKADRNSVSESIQESYKRLREVRKEMKDIQRLMDLMRERTKEMHIAQAAQRQAKAKAAAASAASASAAAAAVAAAQAVPILMPLIERQDSGERSFPDSSPVPEQRSPIGEAAAFSQTQAAAAFAATPASAQPVQASSSTSRPSFATAPSSSSASANDAMMRQRRRMLGMGGPGAPSGGPGIGRSTGPGVSGARSGGGFLGHGTPPSGSSSAGTTGPDPNALSPLNPSAIAVPAEAGAFNALAAATAAGSSLPTPSVSSGFGPAAASAAAASAAAAAHSYRAKYFKTLNLAPKLDFLSTHLSSSTNSLNEQRKDMADSYNMGQHATRRQAAQQPLGS